MDALVASREVRAAVILLDPFVRENQRVCSQAWHMKGFRNLPGRTRSVFGGKATQQHGGKGVTKRQTWHPSRSTNG
jgi:hypothetical protein